MPFIIYYDLPIYVVGPWVWPCPDPNNKPVPFCWCVVLKNVPTTRKKTGNKRKERFCGLPAVPSKTGAALAFIFLQLMRRNTFSPTTALCTARWQIHTDLSLPGEREELVGFIYKYISYLFTTNLRSAFSPKFFEGSWISFENTIPSTITLYRMSHYIDSNWWPVRTNWVSWTAQTIFCTGGQGPVPAHDPTKF